MKTYKDHFTNKAYLTSFFVGLLLLGLSLVVQFKVSNYLSNEPNAPVSDIILSNTRVYDVDGIFVYGPVLLLIFTLALGAKKPNYVPFVMKSIAVFTLIRSVFISLTHITPFPNHIVVSSTFFSKTIFNGIFSGNDLFFSGHTGLPFLLALIFWHNKILRYIFLGFSLMFAVVVLLGHLHYSIDVLSAFFISYAIFDICKFLFKKDRELLMGN